MKKYNFVCGEKFTSKKGVDFLKIEFCDKEGVYTFVTDKVDGIYSDLLGKPYLYEFLADCFFYYSNNQRKVLITACEVK